MNERAVQLDEAKPLPQGWRWVRLDEVCNSESGVWGDVPDNSRYCYPILRSNNIQDGKIILDDVALRRVTEPHIIEAKSLRAGDILVTTSSGSKDLLGKSALFLQPSDGQKYLFSNFTMRLKPKTEVIEPTFLHFYLQSPREKQVLALLQDTTTGLRNLDRKEFLAQTIPLPPLSEQKRIATKVQELMEEMQRARTACEKQLEASKAMPVAYLRQVFESEEAERWGRKRLGEVCDADSGVWGDIADGSSSCYPVLRSNNIQDGKIIFDDTAIRRITGPNIIENKRLRTSDILVTTSSGSKDLLGKSALFVQPSNGKIYLFSNFTMRLRPKLEIMEPHFLYFYLQSPEATQILMLLQDTTTGLRNLDRKEYLNQAIPIPPLTTQQRIASGLTEKITYAENLKAAIEKQLDAMKALPQAILRNAFSGEL